MKLISLVLAIINIAWISALPSVANAAPSGTPVVLHVGSQGPADTQLQQFLHSNLHADFYGGHIDSEFGPLTKAGLESWQMADGYKPSGTITIGSRQWNRLSREAVVTRLAGYISQAAVSAARQTGWAVDASKSPSVVSVLSYSPGKPVQVALSISAAYGGYKPDDNIVHTTYDGVFRIYAEYGRNFVSHEYNNAPMPYAACFNGGQCLHYDGLYPSHGCIHIPSWTAAQFINRLPIGTTVVVHG